MEPKERLKQVRSELGLSTRSIAEALGVGASVYSQWETGQAPVRKPNALAIQAIWGYRWEWLMTGEEPKKLGHGPRRVQEVPLLEGLPSCGPSGELHEMGLAPETIPFSASFISAVLHQAGAGTVDTLFAAHVQGDSMSPTIQAGDTVLVNTALALRLEPRKGALHLVRRAPDSMEARVKRLFFDGSALTLHSDNRTYPPVTIPIDGVPIQDLVIGRVCWYGRSVMDQVPGHGDW